MQVTVCNHSHHHVQYEQCLTLSANAHHNNNQILSNLSTRKQMAHLKEWSCSGLGIGLASEKRQKSLFMMPGKCRPLALGISLTCFFVCVVNVKQGLCIHCIWKTCLQAQTRYPDVHVIVNEMHIRPDTVGDSRPAFGWPIGVHSTMAEYQIHGYV